MPELQQAAQTLHIQRLCVGSASVVYACVCALLRQFLHTSEVQSSSMTFLRSSVAKSSVLAFTKACRSVESAPRFVSEVSITKKRRQKRESEKNADKIQKNIPPKIAP